MVILHCNAIEYCSLQFPTSPKYNASSLKWRVRSQWFREEVVTSFGQDGRRQIRCNFTCSTVAGEGGGGRHYGGIILWLGLHMCNNDVPLTSGGFPTKLLVGFYWKYSQEYVWSNQHKKNVYFFLNSHGALDKIMLMFQHDTHNYRFLYLFIYL
jgi:hypothetical protein